MSLANVAFSVPFVASLADRKSYVFSGFRSEFCPRSSVSGHAPKTDVASRLYVKTTSQGRRSEAIRCEASLGPSPVAAGNQSHHGDDGNDGDKSDAASPANSNTKAPQYVPLHVHSDFSLLDGASRLGDLVNRAAELGVPALALTDHGVLYGAISLLKLCNASSTPVKPIIGNEMYVVNVDTPYTPHTHAERVLSSGAVTDDQKLLNADSLSSTPKSSKVSKNDGASQKRTDRRKAPRRYHLIVLAKNTTGYRNLVHLTTYAHLYGKIGSGIFARPCVNKAMLYHYRDGLVVTSGCLGGEVAQAILSDRPDVARKVAQWYKDVFNDDYYLEMQDHGSAEDKKVNREIVEIGKELSIPIVVTNDSHFTSCLDAEAHDALVCIQTGKLIEDEKRLRYAGNEYFKSVGEMRECFQDHVASEDIESALVNTLQVAEKVEPYHLFGETRIPSFALPPSWSPFDGGKASNQADAQASQQARYLVMVAEEGLRDRLEARMESGLISREPSVEIVRKQYFDRLHSELTMIEKMGFASYFLVVWDYIRFARGEGIPVGPGRGSAAGSLVAFSLRITDIDPIQYNLLFERFLNPERKSMPDIDTDFSVEGRERVIQYVTEKYGEDHVAQIITFNRLTSKAVLKDVARVHRVPYSEADKLAKLIPVVRGKPASLDKMLGKDSPSKDFKKLISSQPGHLAWIEKARRIEGTNKTFGIHAAGVVISAEPLTNAVPLSKAKHGETITQYPMEDVESLGLLKMDFLGLKNLSVIESTLGFINAKRKQVRGSCSPCTLEHKDATEDDVSAQSAQNDDLGFSVDALPLDDRKTFEFLATGELDGIFQLDASAGMRKIVRELRPTNLDDISSILALYRPGPLDAGLVPKFIRRKHGLEPIEYDHPLLEPILKETYGIMVYQEQIMRIARDLAGYSLGQADILRRAMGKKKTSEMEREKPRFVAGAMSKGVSEDVATKLFETMIMFAEYCFNKSHSTAYAYLTYQTAYLKANFPEEYAAALLRANSNQTDKLVRYLADANLSGVQVLPPSINKSQLSFSVNSGVEDGAHGDRGGVLFGLEAIKTVGDTLGQAVIQERVERGCYRSVIDFIERLQSKGLNKRSLRALVMCGAFDELHHNRKVLSEHVEVLLNLQRKLRDRRKRLAKRTMTEEEGQAAIAKEVSEWENVQLNLTADCEKFHDFSMLDKLAGEKETLGFYASGHPLYNLVLAGVVLDSTSVLSIVGEGGDSCDDDHHGYKPVDGSVEASAANSVTAEVADRCEVVCLSLVTDLKRMITSKGRKMAKWTMEDAKARVSAVVFPNAYAVCEAVVGDGATNAREDDVTEKEFVVSNDARVVLWGTVDRESSGTVQVIVDDVQRVEDVRVVLVTSEFKASSSISASDKVELLRGITRSIENPSARYVDSAEEFVYFNKNGEEVKARRRRKKSDLQTKARVPVVFRQLGAAGETLSYKYAGHSCRLSDISEDKLNSLATRTNCDVQVVNLVEYAESLVSDQNESFSRNAELGRESVRSDCSPDSTTVCSSTSELLQKDGEGERHTSALSSVQSLRTNADLCNEQSSQMPSDERGQLREECVTLSISEERVHVQEATVDDNSHEQEEYTENMLETDEREKLFASGELEEMPVERGATEELLPSQKKESKALFAFASAGAPQTSRLLEKLRSRSLSYEETLSRRRAAVPGQDAGRGVVHELNTARPAVEKFEGCKSAVLDGSPDTAAGYFAPVQGSKVSEMAETGVRVKALPTFDNESKDQCSTYALSEDFARGSNREQGFSRDIKHESEPVDFEIPHSGSSVPHPQLQECSGLKSETNVPDTSVTPAVNGCKSDEISLVENTELGSGRIACQEPLSAEFMENMSTEFRVVTSAPGSSVCHFRYDRSNMSRLLDAVCFIAGEAGFSLGRMPIMLKSLDELNVKADSELTDVDIVGTAVRAMNEELHIVVKVKESSPTGERKRIRTLASTVVTFLCLGDGCRDMAPRIVPTKKDVALVEKRLNIASSSDDEEMPDKVHSETEVLCSFDELGPVDMLFDGGYVLSHLCVAAESAARSAGIFNECVVVGVRSFKVRCDAYADAMLRELAIKSQIVRSSRKEFKVIATLMTRGIVAENMDDVVLASAVFMIQRSSLSKTRDFRQNLVV